MPRYELCDCSFPPTNPARVCAFCGELTMGQPEGRCLSNSDTDSDVVSVSNLRVWAREHTDTEGSLWRMRHGGYGSQWVEVRPELIDLTPKDALYKRAESLGLTGLTRIVDDLCALAQYPILDEQDESDAEQEECAEHWDLYGRRDVRKAVVERIAKTEGESLAERAEALIDDMSNKDFDKLYWKTCSEVEHYPERIDSSAWNFGDRDGRDAWAVDALAPIFVALASVRTDPDWRPVDAIPEDDYAV